jgi:hypothetical protein
VFGKLIVKRTASSHDPWTELMKDRRVAMKSASDNIMATGAGVWHAKRKSNRWGRRLFYKLDGS